MLRESFFRSHPQDFKETEVSSSLPSEPAPYSPNATPAAGDKKTKAILSVVFGGVGTLLSFFIPIVSILLGIAGVVLGFLARRSEPAAGKLPLIGIILSFVSIVVAVIITILAAVAVTALLNEGGTM